MTTKDYLDARESFEEYKQRTSGKITPECTTKNVSRKLCNECGEIFDITEFGINTQTGRPKGYCKHCEIRMDQPKQPAIILGKSKTAPLLPGLSERKKEAVNIKAKEMVEKEVTADMVKTKKCVACAEVKPLKAYNLEDGMYKNICRACEKKIALERERKQACQGMEKQEEEAVKIKKQKDKNKKLCLECKKVKPVKEFHVNRTTNDGRAAYCKSCAIIKREKSEEIKAKKLFNDIVIPFAKKTPIFTVKQIWLKLAGSQQTAWNHLNVMEKMGLLEVQKKGVTNWYSISTPKNDEGQYDNLAEEFEDLPETGPKVNMPCSIPELKDEIKDSNYLEKAMETGKAQIENVIEKGINKLIDDGLVKSTIKESLILEHTNEDPEFAELIKTMWEIRSSKRKDYNAGSMNNFELTHQLLGLPSHVGILVRISDKLSRLGSFTQKGYLEVKDESVEDTLLDLANYSLLCLMEYRKDKGAST